MNNLKQLIQDKAILRGGNRYTLDNILCEQTLVVLFKT